MAEFTFDATSLHPNRPLSVMGYLEFGGKGKCNPLQYPRISIYYFPLDDSGYPMTNEPADKTVLWVDQEAEKFNFGRIVKHSDIPRCHGRKTLAIAVTDQGHPPTSVIIDVKGTRPKTLPPGHSRLVTLGLNAVTSPFPKADPLTAKGTIQPATSPLTIFVTLYLSQGGSLMQKDIQSVSDIAFPTTTSFVAPKFTFTPLTAGNSYLIVSTANQQHIPSSVGFTAN